LLALLKALEFLVSHVEAPALEICGAFQVIERHFTVRLSNVLCADALAAVRLGRKLRQLEWFHSPEEFPLPGAGDRWAPQHGKS